MTPSLERDFEEAHGDLNHMGQGSLDGAEEPYASLQTIRQGFLCLWHSPAGAANERMGGVYVTRSLGRDEHFAPYPCG